MSGTETVVEKNYFYLFIFIFPSEKKKPEIFKNASMLPEGCNVE